ncbi:MAG: hypothetical protein GTO24_11215 [candidate division Zixibacteria bacterium]|nr:hypothetical protein [candidate division Zixibacteria bacterium]
MKIVCLECHREVGEKYPFDDDSATHTICPGCVEKMCMKAGNESLRRKFIKTFRKEVSLRFDPEVDSLVE